MCNASSTVEDVDLDHLERASVEIVDTSNETLGSVLQQCDQTFKTKENPQLQSSLAICSSLSPNCSLSTDCLFPSARTTPLSNLPTEDPYASDIGLLLGIDKIFEYQLEKETDFLPADGDGSQDELIEHLKKANDELLHTAKYYKGKCDKYEKKWTELTLKERRKK